MKCTIILKYLVNGWDVLEKRFDDVPYGIGALGSNESMLIVYDTSMSDAIVFVVPVASVVSVEVLYGGK